LILAVPSFCASAAASADYFHDRDARQGVLRGALRVAATERLVPDFYWVDVDALVEATSLNPLNLSLQDLALVPLAAGNDWALFARAAQLSHGLVSPVHAHVDPTLGVLSDTGLERRMLTSGLYVQSATGIGFGVDAVFADQRFASWTLSPLVEQSTQTFPAHSIATEESRGTGLALALGGPFTDQLGWSIGLRSRVDMNAYKRFQGVYSEPGDLDIPATAALGLTASVLPGAEFVLGAEHVFYSEINSFTSYALPNRFLALLGDSNSPSFEWQDLTVYSAAVQGDIAAWQWSVRYSTSLQPNPTSQLLQQAIQGIQSDSNWSLGMGRSFGSLGDVRLSASYAGSEYVLGSPYLSNVDPTESTHFEFEALWNVKF
jgi:hypothetical protein